MSLFRTCSARGSYATDFLTSAPRAYPGMFVFGPSGLEQGAFEPVASSYLEAIIFLALPGALIFLALSLTTCCFCYRRYRLGRCGEPFPTVKGYTPRQVALCMAVALASFLVLGALGYFAITVANAAFAFAYDSLLDAGSALEVLLRAAFATGHALLGAATGTVTELGLYEAAIRERVDVASLLTDLECSRTLLGALPNGSHALATAQTLGVATAGFPPKGTTDALFSDLRLPVERYPSELPPLIAGIVTLGSQAAALPDLPLLESRLAELNASVLNTTVRDRHVTTT